MKSIRIAYKAIVYLATIGIFLSSSSAYSLSTCSSSDSIESSDKTITVPGVDQYDFVTGGHQETLCRQAIEEIEEKCREAIIQTYEDCPKRSTAKMVCKPATVGGIGPVSQIVSTWLQAISTTLNPQTLEAIATTATCKARCDFGCKAVLVESADSEHGAKGSDSGRDSDRKDISDFEPG